MASIYTSIYYLILVLVLCDCVVNYSYEIIEWDNDPQYKLSCNDSCPSNQVCTWLGYDSSIINLNEYGEYFCCYYQPRTVVVKAVFVKPPGKLAS